MNCVKLVCYLQLQQMANRFMDNNATGEHTEHTEWKSLRFDQSIKWEYLEMS